MSDHDDTVTAEIVTDTVPVSVPVSVPAEPQLPRPRTRWGAIAWGLIVVAVAAATLWISSSTERRAGFGDWLGGLTPGTIGVLVVLAVGVIVLVLAALGLSGRARK